MRDVCNTTECLTTLLTLFKAVAAQYVERVGSYEVLENCARMICLQDCISTNPSQGLEPPSQAVTAKAVQAMVGGVWIVSGENMEDVRQVLHSLGLLSVPMEEWNKNHKSHLNRRFQKSEYNTRPQYLQSICSTCNFAAQRRDRRRELWQITRRLPRFMMVVRGTYYTMQLNLDTRSLRTTV